MTDRTISQYRLLRQLGRGGMGEVYLAEDVRVGHRVAIKLLPQQLAHDRAAKTRFLREARAIAQLNHPYILPLHEFDEHEGELYFVTTYMAGGSLRDALRSAGDAEIPLERILRWGVQAAEGLAAAHRSGVIHRDIKPDNLLLNEDGDLRICDFGLASVTDATRITHTGTSMGTLGYMSPEQVRGQRVDSCTDLFSLGATLFELLTGDSPFARSDQAAILHAIAYEEAPSLRTIRKDLPEDLVALVEELLRKDPTERLCSAEAAAARLRTLAESAGAAESMPLPALDHVAPPGPNRVLVWTALAVLTLAIVGGVAWWMLTHESGAEGSRDENLVDSQSDEEDDDPQSDEARSVRFAVLPFSVQGGEMVQALGEGMVELVSSRLDGAGPLRRQARDLAASEDLDLLVKGTVVEAAGQLHLSAGLYETDTSGLPIVEVSAEGPVEELHSLLDGLSTELLLGRLAMVDEVPYDIESIQTESLPALKSYLEGEWTRSNVAGIAACEKAVEQDPRFAMAWMCLARRQLPGATGYDRAREAVAHAWEFSEQLTPSTLQHLRAVEAFLEGDAAKTEEICRAILSNDPGNLEAWRILEATYRLIGWKFGKLPAEALPVLERSKELGDNVDWILAGLHGWQQGIEDPSVRIRSSSQPARVLYSGRQDAIDSLLTEWRETPSWILLRNPLMAFPLPRDVPIPMQRAVAVLTEDTRSAEIQSYGYVMLGYLEVERGRWLAAQAHFGRARELDFPLAIEHQVLIATSPFLPVPKAELRALRDDLARWNVDEVVLGSDETRQIRIHDDHHAHLRLYLMGALSARLGEEDAALAYARELEELPGPPQVIALAQDLAHGIRGRLLWQQGDLEQALTELEKARYPSDPDYFFYSPFHLQSQERYLRAEMLAESGRLEEALGWYPQDWLWSLEYVYLAPRHLRYAQILAELGESERALEHYARFLEYWGDCEPELQPVVASARDEMQELEREVALHER